MVTVTCSHSPFLLRKNLNARSGVALKRECAHYGWYLHCGTGSKESCLIDYNSYGLKPHIALLPSMEKRESILRDYVDVVGLMSELNGEHEKWWATDLASKNRFTSPLNELLNVFVQCVDAIKKAVQEDKSLLIVNPPWPVTVVLRRMAQQLGCEVQIISWPWSRVLAGIRGQAMSWLVLLRGAVGAIGDILKARMAFGFRLPTFKADTPVYLIKSFVYPNSFGDNGAYRDPFFGDLAEFIAKDLAGKAEVITVALGFSDKVQCYKKMRLLEQSRVVPLESFIRIPDLIAAFFKLAIGLIVKPFQVPAHVPFMGENIAPLFREMLACGGWRVQFFQYLHMKAAIRIARRQPLLACVITYEGNPWERMLIMGLRKQNPDVHIIGYQHAVIPQSAAGLFLSAREAGLIPHPDRIITTGGKTADILKRYSSFASEKIQAGCALRYSYLYNLDLLPRHLPSGRPFTVLVALEGVMEVTKLLSYAIQQAGVMPDIRFNLRAHPVFPLDNLLKIIGRCRSDLPTNMTVSCADKVIEDIRTCDTVLYWGTTVAVEALMMGRPVVHFDRGDVLSFDPLFELTYFKWTVDQASLLEAVVGQIQRMADDEYSHFCTLGRDYVKEYLSKTDASNLIRFTSKSHELLKY